MVEVDPPFAAEPDWDEETDVARLTEIHTRRLEAAIRKAPEQYFWLHDRYRYAPAPPGEGG